MKGSKRISSPAMVPRKAHVIANAVGDPCVMIYPGREKPAGPPYLFSPMEARQLAKDINEALEALAGD
jgi:molybdopterin-biosynthesis enzyme MoeA-like protein